MDIKIQNMSLKTVAQAKFQMDMCSTAVANDDYSL